MVNSGAAATAKHPTGRRGLVGCGRRVMNDGVALDAAVRA